MTDERYWGLLDRFLAGECSPPERAAVLEWLEVHPFAAEYIEAVRRALAQHEVKPLAVHAGPGVIWDLGTRFGVRAYADEPEVEVVVAAGKVRVRGAGNPDSAGQVVNGGELSRLDHTGVASPPRRVDTRRYLAWTEGRLAFQDAPLRDVLPQLARWYDVDLTLGSPSLGDRHVTLSVRGEPVAQVLDAIALLAHARYERAGRSVTFYPTKPER